MKMSQKQQKFLRKGVALILTVSLFGMALAGCATPNTVESETSDEDPVESMILSETVESSTESEVASEPVESAVESAVSSAVERQAVVVESVSSAVASKAAVEPVSSTVSNAAVESTPDSASSVSSETASAASDPVSSSGGSVAEQTGKRRIPMYLVAKDASDFTVAVTVDERVSQLYTESDFKEDPENPGTKNLRVNIQTGNLISVVINGNVEIVDVLTGERGGTNYYYYDSIASEALNGSGTEAVFTIESMKIDAVRLEIVG